jgi:hypothetical protein
MGVLVGSVFGLIVGAVAKRVTPGRDPGGILVTILLAWWGPSGVAGSGRPWGGLPRVSRRDASWPWSGPSSCCSSPAA